MIWIFHCLFDICSFFCIFFRKKRLKNKDIAFYASLNSDSANDDGEKRNINSVRLFISTAN